MVHQQVVIPSHRFWQLIFIWYPRRINIYKNTTGYGVVNKIRIYAWWYIVTDYVYLLPCTVYTSLVKGIYQDYETQGGIK